MLRHRSGTQSSTLTDSEGKYTFYLKPEGTDTLEVKPYEIRLPLDPTVLDWNDHPNTYTNILLYDPQQARSVAAAFYNNAVHEPARRFSLDVANLLQNKTVPLSWARFGFERLERKYFNNQYRINTIANVYARSDFSELDPSYYKAFNMFSRHNLDLASTYLSDYMLGQDVQQTLTGRQVKATAYMIKAAPYASIDRPDDSAEARFNRAVQEDKRFYTICSLSDYLLENQRYTEAASLVDDMWTNPRQRLDLEDSLHVYQQFIRLYAHGEAEKPQLAIPYSLKVIDQEQRIMESKTPRLQYILRNALTQLIDFSRKTWDHTKDPATARDLTRYSLQLYRFDSLLIATNTDSFLLTAVDPSQHPADIAAAYDTVFSQQDTAGQYFKATINTARNFASRAEDVRYIPILKTRYHDLATSRLQQQEKISFLRRQIKVNRHSGRWIRKYKRELKKYIRSLIRDIRNGKVV